MHATASLAIGALLIRARSKNYAPRVSPTGCLDDWAYLAVGLVEAVEPRISVRLHQPRIADQMLLGMLTATIARIEEYRCQWIGAGKRPVVAHIGP